VTCDILIRSYYRDFRWLKYCLASLDLFARGFSRRIVVVPESSVDWLSVYDLRPQELRVCPNVRNDYVGQQLTKLYADELSDADLIYHFDSDCVVAGPLSPEDLCEDGKPVLWMTPFEELSPISGRRQGVKRLLGVDVPFDFMRRLPIVFPNWLYPALRRHVEELHGRDFRTTVCELAPEELSEFNTLAAFAYLHHRDSFRWRIVRASETDAARCRVYWSRGGLTPSIEQEITALLGSGA